MQDTQSNTRDLMLLCLHKLHTASLPFCFVPYGHYVCSSAFWSWNNTDKRDVSFAKLCHCRSKNRLFLDYLQQEWYRLICLSYKSSGAKILKELNKAETAKNIKNSCLCAAMTKLRWEMSWWILNWNRMTQRTWMQRHELDPPLASGRVLSKIRKRFISTPTGKLNSKKVI